MIKVTVSNVARWSRQDDAEIHFMFDLTVAKAGKTQNFGPVSGVFFLKPEGGVFRFDGGSNNPLSELPTAEILDIEAQVAEALREFV